MNLKHIEINIGKACNNKCVFCMSSNANSEMLKLVDFNYLKTRIKKYADEGFNSIGFLGGDISIHPKIIEIIEYSKEIGYKEINIITNGMLFSNYEFAEKIVKAGATRINLSIHSHIPKIEDFITKVPGGLEKKIKAIENFQLLQKKGFLKNNLSMNLVLNKLNLENIVETCLFYNNLGINDIRINFIWLADFNGLMKNREELSISYSQILTYLKQIIYISLKYKIRITFDTIPPCILFKINNVNINLLINNFIGEQFDKIDKIEHTNVINDNETFNWKNRKINFLKTKRIDCIKCKYDNICEGVWKDYETIYGLNELEIIK